MAAWWVGEVSGCGLKQVYYLGLATKVVHNKCLLQRGHLDPNRAVSTRWKIPRCEARRLGLLQPLDQRGLTCLPFTHHHELEFGGFDRGRVELGIVPLNRMDVGGADVFGHRRRSASPTEVFKARAVLRREAHALVRQPVAGRSMMMRW